MDQSAETPAFSYDRVAYPSPLLPDQSPDRLCVSALLHGLRTADPAAASVLEIGCGNGLNLLAHAAAFPKSRVVGFDLSQTAIARGSELAAAAGLANADLQAGDILSYPRAGPAFDYIVCHGVFSWVPEPVRDGILDLIAARLAPGGLAYLSFEILPGAAAKALIVRFLRRQLRDGDTIADAAARAAKTIAALSRSQSDSSPLKLQLETLARTQPWRNAGYFYHDWLSEHYTPVDLEGFIADAAGHGLRVAGTAGNYDLGDQELDDAGDELLASFGDDPAQRLVGIEMLQGPHPFHRSLLVRADAPPPQIADGVRRLSYAFAGSREDVETDDGPAVQYGTSETLFVTTNHPASIKVFDALIAARPDEIGFDELLRRTGLDASLLEAVLGEIANGYVVHSHASAQPYTSEPGERPSVTSLSRLILASDNRAISLRGIAVEANQPETSACLQLCDGTRTRGQIAAEMERRFDRPFSAEMIGGAIAAFAKQGVFEARSSS